MTLCDEFANSLSQRIAVEEEESASRGESTTLEWPLHSEVGAETFTLTEDPLPHSLDWLEAIGVSSNEFHSIVDGIGGQDLPHELYDPPPIWMIRGDISS